MPDGFDQNTGRDGLELCSGRQAAIVIYSAGLGRKANQHGTADIWMTMDSSDDCDLFIVGGGINGCGIARDAAGRGMKVKLAEMGDLGSATSSASTKLFHGGLRYLEHFEFRLVRESLIEREVLLSAMPHISWPLRFVLPYDPGDKRSRLAAIVPAKGHRRPAWMLKMGLFLYDHLGGRKILPGSNSLDLTASQEGSPLNSRFEFGFEYSDCWVNDSRLVALNARDAWERGAVIMVRTKVESGQRNDGRWLIKTRNTSTGEINVHASRAVVNAGGPWVAEVHRDALGLQTASKVRLVRGSHIVTPRLYDHDKCYILLGDDGRVVFTIPYENDFTLIGTTDAEHGNPDVPPECTIEERNYLIDIVNRSFLRPIAPDDVVWSYSGVRPLHDDGAGSASAVTRDYSLEVDERDGAPALSVFGGKITTYRRLAENAVDRLSAHFPGLQGKWTAGVPLPGGDFPVDGFANLVSELCKEHPFLLPSQATRLARAYGTDSRAMLDGSRCHEDLGKRFGDQLTVKEVAWMIEREFARTAEDILWRRSKLGLTMSKVDQEALDRFISEGMHEFNTMGTH